MSRVLVLSPHTDDAEWGCGATIAKHVENGDEVTVITFSSCSDSLPSYIEANALKWEHVNSMAALGVEDFLILDYPVRRFEEHSSSIRHIIWRLINECVKPDIVYTPWLGSLHQDHAVIAKCARQVCRHRDMSVYGYYICDDGTGFSPNHFEILNDSSVSKKFKALECYNSQKVLRKWWTLRNFESIVRYWAPSTTAEFTEAFEVIRSITK